MQPVLPVALHTVVFQEKRIKLYYPQVTGLSNAHVQQTMNADIHQQVQSLLHQQYEAQDVTTFLEIIGTYEIKNNQRNILSLTLSNYAYANQHAHGLTFMASLTFDTTTGKAYTLPALFKPQADYQHVLTNAVQRQIKTRDIPVIEPLTQISADQAFYIADKTLVLYFQQYALAPYYYGLPVFPITVFDLQAILTEDGPLGRMATNP